MVGTRRSPVRIIVLGADVVERFYDVVVAGSPHRESWVWVDEDGRDCPIWEPGWFIILSSDWLDRDWNSSGRGVICRGKQ